MSNSLGIEMLKARIMRILEGTQDPTYGIKTLGGLVNAGGKELTPEFFQAIKSLVKEGKVLIGPNSTVTRA